MTIPNLPPVRGALTVDRDLSGLTWMRVGGFALASQTEAAHSIGKALIELAKMMP